MYNHDIIKVPKKISRDEFVNIIFDIGLNYELGYDILITAVEIGDKFVSLKNTYYSLELAQVSTVLSSKTDDFYYKTSTALDETNNGIVLSMEWEIFIALDFHIKTNNFINFICRCLLAIEIAPKLSSVFWDLSKNLCMDEKLLKIDPYTILAGCILLNKIGKLKAIKDNKRRIFADLIEQISHEYEIDISDLLKKIIEIKNDI